jgi:hypothetical protein
VRREFLDSSFEALYWDITNKQGHAEAATRSAQTYSHPPSAPTGHWQLIVMQNTWRGNDLRAN